MYKVMCNLLFEKVVRTMYKGVKHVYKCLRYDPVKFKRLMRSY